MSNFKVKKDETTFEKLKLLLEKARRRMSDEVDEDPEDALAPEEMGMREFEPTGEADDEADKWLAANDPEKSENKPEPEEYDPETEREKNYEEIGRAHV